MPPIFMPYHVANMRYLIRRIYRRFKTVLICMYGYLYIRIYMRIYCI